MSRQNRLCKCGWLDVSGFFEKALAVRKLLNLNALPHSRASMLRERERERDLTTKLASVSTGLQLG